MEEIKKLLEAREKELIKLKQEKEKALQNVPKGALRICNSGNKTQYYYREEPEDHSGTYISVKQQELISKLAQKEYDQKVLRAVNQELTVVQRYLTGCPTATAEQVYERLHIKRQKLIHPIRESDEAYIKKWESAEYQTKGFDINIPEFYTAKGERVRSKSELIIADLLNKEEIPYRYEASVYLKGWGLVYPDFTVLNVKKRQEFYWEHLGMMDDSSYAEKALQKISMYEQNGIFPGEKLIITYETRKSPLNQKQLANIIEHYM